MRKSMLIFIIAYIFAIYVWMFVFKDNQFMYVMVGGNIFPIIGAGISSAWLFKSFRSLTGKERHFWLLLCVGNVFFILAQCTWIYQINLHKHPPYPNAADFLWLVQYLFYLIALIFKISITKGVSLSRFIFNIAIFMTTAIILSDFFLINPILDSSFNSTLAMIVSLAFPIIDLSLLLATIGLYYLSKYNINKKILSLITLGFFIQIFVDSAHTYLLSIDKYIPGGIIDPLWIIPLFMNGLASLYALQLSQRTKQEVESTPFYKHEDNVFPYLIGFFLLLYEIFVDDNNRIDSLDIGLIVVVLLIFARQVIVMVENRKLLLDLESKNNELGKSEERYRQLVEISPTSICVDIEGEIVYINKAGLDLLGAESREEVVGKLVYDFVSGDHMQTVQLRRKKAGYKKVEIEYFEYPIVRLDGQIIYVESRLAEITYNGKKAYMSISEDVTYRKKSEERIMKMAYFDKLTQLPNREMLHSDLQKMMKDAHENNSQLAAMFIDLDRFKYINDTMGHTFGDLFLKKVAQRMVRILDGYGTIYRFGGDEFCVLIEEANQEKAIMIAKKIIEGFTETFSIENGEIYTTPSIGISLYPSDGEDEDSVIKYADIAMYKAKALGGNSYQLYTKLLKSENANKMEIENALRNALIKKEFLIHYQPKINLTSQKIIGLEALIRWNHTKWGMVAPLQFISIAEDTGLIVPIGSWILKEACLQMKKWHNEGFDYLSIAVNISPRQFQDKEFITMLTSVLNDSQLDPQYLQIEITENIMNNFQESSSILTELKKLGVKISIDDFGTGYSSLSYLKHLPIDDIKIDKSFVDDIPISHKDVAIVKTIIDMGHHLKINVTAEGIETEQQLLSLRKHKCNDGQGYYFSKPLPPEEVEKLF